MLTKAQARARVARGAAHLDKARPGWFNRIDVGTLTLHEACGCIVGQLCGLQAYGGLAAGEPFNTGVALLFGRTSYAEAMGVSLGTYEDFDDDDRPGAGYRLLQDCWIREIAARRHPVAEAEAITVSDPVQA